MKAHFRLPAVIRENMRLKIWKKKILRKLSLARAAANPMLSC